MSKKFVSILTKSFLGAVLISGSLFAAESTENDQKEHILVGIRSMSHAERVKTKEARIELVEKVKKGEEDLQLTEEEQVELATAEQADSESKVAKNVPKATYLTTHKGAFHNPVAVSLLGDAVELEDGSIWSVCSSDRYKTLDWMTGDLIVITSNHSIFSSYDYHLINLNTGAKIRVNLSLGPIYNGIYTHWIIAIDYLWNEICLEDGSVWKISSLDGSVLNKWLPNDTIIMGINDGWFSGSNPNMLINVNMNNIVIGKCVN